MSFKVAVVGAGRMGKLHARVLSEMPGAELVCIVDSNASAATALAKQRSCQAMTDPAAAAELVDAAVIAVPTVAHLAAARPFIERGKPVLIEKPFTNDIPAGQELIDLAKKNGVPMQVGQTERFNPVAVAARKYAIVPKFIEGHRISPFTFRSADVGVVLDIMIHDIDLVLMMVKSPLLHVDAVGVNVIGAHEDICNARLTFCNGCVANLTASRLAIKTERKMRIFSEQAYLSIDYAKKVGVVVEKGENIDLIQMAREMDVNDLAELAASMDYTKLIKVEELQVDESSEPLRMQAEAFRQTVEQGAAPAVSAEDGLAAVRVAHQIVESVGQHKWDGDLSPRTGPDLFHK